MTLFDSAALDDALRIVRTHLPLTPQYRWPLPAEATGAEVWVKHENHTPTAAFKIRGGLVLLDGRRATGRSGPIVTATISRSPASTPPSCSAPPASWTPSTFRSEWARGSAV